MGPRRAALLVAGAFLAFAAWEAIQHVWFMDLPMSAYHLLSLTVDLILVLLIALAALGIVRRHAHRDACRQAAQDAITTALTEDLRPHLLPLLTQLRGLPGSQPGWPSEETRRLVEQAEARAAVVLDMIEDLVAMAADVQKPGPRCAAVSLDQLADQAVETLRSAAEDKGVKLQAHVPQASLPGCRYPDAVLRALLRLLRHALDSTAPAGSIELRASVDEAGGTLALSVTHTAEPLLDHPADLDEVISKHGLMGLREVQALADALGGAIRYQPEPHGNTFTLSLPHRETPA